MANMTDVARRARVSIATVSAVINKSAYVSPLLVTRVERAIAELNYSPNFLARSLAQRKTNTVGILIPDVANPFFPEIVRGAEDRLQKSGYTLLLGSSDNRADKEDLYLRLFLAKRVDGILLVKAAGEIPSETVSLLQDGGPPMVLVDREYSGVRTDVVLADDRGGAFEAVCHLLRLGYRRIGILVGIPGTSTAAGRIQGYKDALQRFRVPFDPDLVAVGRYDIESGYGRGHELMGHRPEAVFVTNYMMTIGFLKAMKELRLRCPEDLALVSYDHFLWNDFFSPQLTSVEQPKYALGWRSAEVLLGRIEGKHKRPRRVILKNQLHLGDSCGRLLKTRGKRLSKAAVARTPAEAEPSRPADPAW